MISCATCTYWEPIRALYADADGRGKCRAALPTVKAGGLTVWPLTHGRDDWCATWTERQEPAQTADPDPDHLETFL